MWIRAGSLPEELTSTTEFGTIASTRLGRAGGLRHFGANLQVLQPGARASLRHWHEEEDEFLYVLDGELTLLEDAGETVLHAGDSACWPAGEANAHTVCNRSSQPCRVLVVGSRAAFDVCHYPLDGCRRVIEGDAWQRVADDGRVLEAGVSSTVPAPRATELRAMRPEAFAAFCEEASQAYAADNTRAGRWSAATALDQARSELATLLPAGLATPGHHLFELWDLLETLPVGALWLAATGQGEARTLFVYQVMVWPECRQRGHARAALQQLDALAQGLNCTHVALHVFRHNAGAHRLYEALGFRTNSLNLRRPVRPVEA